MEYKKITEVNEVAEVTGTEYVYLNQGGKFVQIPLPIFLAALDIQGGADGKDGTSPTVSVTAIDNGHRITITDVSGSRTIDVLNGQPGKDGMTPNLQIGTVTTLPAGSPATAEITGTAANPVLSLGIPKGADAASGSASVSSINGLTGAVSLPVSGSCVCNSAASDRLKVLTSVSSGFDPSADGAILAAQFKNPNNTANSPELQIGQTVYTILHPNNLTPPAASALKKSVHHFSMRGSTRAAILLDPYVAPSTVDVDVDATLTQSGKAADAKAVGTALATRVPAAPLDSDAGKVATVGSDGIPRWETLPAVGSLFGRCSTAAYDAAKKVSYIDGAIVGGTIITVEFTNANEAENPTLTANGVTGAIVGRTLDPIRATDLTAGIHRFVCLSNYDSWLMLDIADGQGKNDVWRTICQIDVTEPTIKFNISKDDQGNPFSLRKLLVFCHFLPAAGSPSGYCGLVFNGGNNNINIGAVPSESDKQRVDICLIDTVVGKLMPIMARKSANGDSVSEILIIDNNYSSGPGNFKVDADGNLLLADSPCTSINLGGVYPVGVGSKITIWGVDA